MYVYPCIGLMNNIFYSSDDDDDEMEAATDRAYLTLDELGSILRSLAKTSTSFSYVF